VVSVVETVVQIRTAESAETYSASGCIVVILWWLWCLTLLDWQWKDLYHHWRSWTIRRPRYYTSSSFLRLRLLREGNLNIAILLDHFNDTLFLSFESSSSISTTDRDFFSCLSWMLQTRWLEVIGCWDVTGYMST